MNNNSNQCNNNNMKTQYQILILVYFITLLFIFTLYFILAVVFFCLWSAAIHRCRWRYTNSCCNCNCSTHVHAIQGALIGSLSALILVTWINVGRVALDITYPTLPQTSVDRCPAAVTNDTSLWQQSNVTRDWTSASSTTQSYYVTQVCPRFRNVFVVLVFVHMLPFNNNNNNKKYFRLWPI